MSSESSPSLVRDFIIASSICSPHATRSPRVESCHFEFVLPSTLPVLVLQVTAPPNLRSNRLNFAAIPNLPVLRISSAAALSSLPKPLWRRPPSERHPSSITNLCRDRGMATSIRPSKLLYLAHPHAIPWYRVACLIVVSRIFVMPMNFHQ